MLTSCLDMLTGPVTMLTSSATVNARSLAHDAIFG
jgi:hypothetical protein